jgi:hypothetical protein
MVGVAPPSGMHAASTKRARMDRAGESAAAGAGISIVREVKNH